MLEYRCPKCDEVFVTFKILCHHAERCHEIGYLLREKIKKTPSFNTGVSFLAQHGRQSPSGGLVSRFVSGNSQEDEKASPTWSPRPSTKLISEIRDSFKRIGQLTNKVGFESIQSVQSSNSQPPRNPDWFASSSVDDGQKQSSTNYRDGTLSLSEISESGQLFRPDTKLGSNAIIELVCFYLDQITLWKLRSVCKLWRDIVQMPKYWNKLRLINCFIVPKFLDNISDFCQNLTSITFEDVDLKNSLKGALEKPLQSILTKSRRRITSVSIINCGINLTERVISNNFCRTLWLVSCHCPYLEEFAYISATNPANSESIWSLGAGCRRLRTLIIPPVYPSQHPERFSDRCLTTIGKSWSDLKILCVGGTNVSLKGLLAIDFCKRLQKIKVVIAPSDFFVQPEYPDNKIEYEKKVISLQNLSRYCGLDEILTVVDLNQ